LQSTAGDGGLSNRIGSLGFAMILLKGIATPALAGGARESHKCRLLSFVLAYIVAGFDNPAKHHGDLSNRIFNTKQEQMCYNLILPTRKRKDVNVHSSQ
jgi:hypothetical protein